MNRVSDTARFSIAGILAAVLFSLSAWTLYTVTKLERDVTVIETDERWILEILKRNYGDK